MLGVACGWVVLRRKSANASGSVPEICIAGALQVDLAALQVDLAALQVDFAALQVHLGALHVNFECVEYGGLNTGVGWICALGESLSGGGKDSGGDLKVRFTCSVVNMCVG